VQYIALCQKESFEKLHYDLYYVKNMSLALDIGIMLRTFRRVFKEDVSFLADTPRKIEIGEELKSGG